MHRTRLFTVLIALPMLVGLIPIQANAEGGATLTVKPYATTGNVIS